MPSVSGVNRSNVVVRRAIPPPGLRILSPPWSRVEGKSQVILPQMPPLRGGICVGVDQRDHPFALELPQGWILIYLVFC